MRSGETQRTIYLQGRLSVRLITYRRAYRPSLHKETSRLARIQDKIMLEETEEIRITNSEQTYLL